MAYRRRIVLSFVFLLGFWVLPGAAEPDDPIPWQEDPFVIWVQTVNRLPEASERFTARIAGDDPVELARRIAADPSEGEQAELAKLWLDAFSPEGLAAHSELEARAAPRHGPGRSSSENPAATRFCRSTCHFPCA